jgi:hypothetical protein
MNISYSNLVRITQTEKPIRGTTNKFPYFKRSHSGKFFLVEEVNGVKEFHLSYGSEYIAHNLTQDEWQSKQNEMSTRELNRVNIYRDQITYHEIVSKKFGIVRSDNSLEITTDDADQGTRLMLNNMIWQGISGGVVNSIRHGGTVFKTYTSDKIVPIFKGLRVYIDRDEIRIHPDCNYKVVTRSLDKTKSSLVMKPYRKKLKFVETIFKTMDGVTFMTDFMDVIVNTDHPYLEKLKTDGTWYDEIDSDAIKYANSIFESNPMNAMYHFMVAFNSNWIKYRIREYMDEQGNLDKYHVSSGRYNPIAFFNDAKRKFERIMKLSSDIFIKHTYHAGQPYPSSIWQIDVILNDQVVRTTQGE